MGKIKKTVRNDCNMVPLRNSRPRKLTSIILVLSWLVVIVPTGLWQARGQRMDNNIRGLVSTEILGLGRWWRYQKNIRFWNNCLILHTWEFSMSQKNVLIRNQHNPHTYIRSCGSHLAFSSAKKIAGNLVLFHR
jgi:hypothetical protein